VIFMFPHELRSETKEKPGRGVYESETDVKKAVRKRDQNQCRDCGMTHQEHLAKYDRDLQVHRLVPRTNYVKSDCVTLCIPCHGKKPRRTEDAFWCKDLRWLGFNLYDQRDAAIYRILQMESQQTGKDVGDIVRDFLEERLVSCEKRDHADLVLTGDGLW
jgi:5-methylcytosine-specific restriction endonuclease McrA